ncbi:MAG: bifunctional demethylmenaquinone methyltransferase/2-methoxy-6-polyprenyl-1,4-benzoquinol methylase UbiE [Candidatus Krumholzibacteria bacterium]|nr:bifunctional demethylmenaquinone methyltransferase/2-methoxy-6-polyprenyl-1,4-benzoquinol methylase UbiE [Candidatus Krumholzibacteria bacterium]
MRKDVDRAACGSREAAAPDKKRLVAARFDKIAPRYDLANSLLSFGLHYHWRRYAVRRLALKRGENVLDLCGGTGDFAVLAASRVASDGTVTVCDVSPAMIRAGRLKVERSGNRDAVLWVQGDAEDLSFPDGAFDAVTVGFGVRNLACLEAGLREMFRVLKAGGRLAILEFSVPETRLFRKLYEWYSFRVMPFVGRAVTGAAEPYTYLAESIRVFPPPAAFKASLEAAGFTNVTIDRLTAGITAVYLCEKEADSTRGLKPTGSSSVE